MIVVSVASYDKRLSYLQKTIYSILNQSLSYDKLIINIPDNTNTSTIDEFISFTDIDDRISVSIRDSKWRSANKLLWTAKEHPNDVIITCDDDIFYPLHFFEELHNHWTRNSDCIIAHETSPVLITGDKLRHISAVDVKLKQKCFGRYLTGCCLFPPHVLDETEAYDFDKFFKTTNATHDELWFWCMTTLKKIRSIGLNFTHSFDSDELVLPRDQNSLSTINSDPYLTTYNAAINETFGKELTSILQNQTVEFIVDPDSLLGFCSQAQKIYSLYGSYHIKVKCIKLLKSHLKIMGKSLDPFNWEKRIEIELYD